MTVLQLEVVIIMSEEWQAVCRGRPGTLPVIQTCATLGATTDLLIHDVILFKFNQWPSWLQSKSSD